MEIKKVREIEKDSGKEWKKQTVTITGKERV